MRSLLYGFVLLLVSASGFVNAQADQAPDCTGHGQVLPVNNDQLLAWKTTTANSFRDRAHLLGTVVQVYADHSGHHHMSVRIGAQTTDTVEVIYNEDFGSVPSYGPGSTIEACGDYITSNAPSGYFPASPDGAIVHWVHESPNPERHESGFLMIDGTLCGDLPENAGPKPPHRH